MFGVAFANPHERDYRRAALQRDHKVVTMPAMKTMWMALVLALAGCAGSGRRESGPVYPSGAPQGQTLNIHVVRRETKIELTNTTAQTFGPSRVWLNGWFSRDIDGLAPGETIVLNLGEFTDRYGERFKAGGFWATQAPDELVLAQLERPEGGQLLGLIVIGEEDR